MPYDINATKKYLLNFNCRIQTTNCEKGAGSRDIYIT